MIALPAPTRTIAALMRGYFPRLLQVRGWVCAAILVLPVMLTFGVSALFTFKQPNFRFGSQETLWVFHKILAQLALPILVLVAAPAGIREDLEQRTLPLVLTRPAQAWILPLGKGLLWFGWGALWIIVSTAGLAGLGADAASLPFMMGALLAAFWAELAFMTLLGLIFKRGTLWGALYLLIWDPLVRVFPGNLQRITFIHYIESIAGSRGGSVSASQLLAQEQITTFWPIAILVLFLFGLACWAASGWRLHRTPIGLAGSEAEG
jgi:ABC-type transport system involved in multi-copper enzyme maturation permease subunit